MIIQIFAGFYCLLLVKENFIFSKGIRATTWIFDLNNQEIITMIVASLKIIIITITIINNIIVITIIIIFIIMFKIMTS